MDAVAGVGHQARFRFQPVFRHRLAAGQKGDGGAVVDGRGVARRDGALLLEGGAQLRELLEVDPGRLLVLADDHLPLARLLHHRDDLVVEDPVPQRRLRLLVGGDGKAVLELAVEAVVLRAFLGDHTHVLAAVRVGQAVVHQQVEHLGVAHAVAVAPLAERVGGKRHVLHAAGQHQVGVAKLYGAGAEHDRFQPGAADLVDGEGGDRVGEPRVAQGLTRGSLAGAAGEDLADYHLVYGVGGKPGALQDAGDDGGGKTRRLYIAERSAEGAQRGTQRFDDKDL